jgi:Holliday junction resolvasome RuvABC endonuclease subunit
MARCFRLPHHERLYNKERLLNMMKKHGFKVIKTKREFILPAQLGKINKKFNKILDNYAKQINSIDNFLTKTPLSVFAQSFFIQCKKSRTK